MKEIVYSQEAKNDLLAIKNEITEKFNEPLAKKIISKIIQSINNISVYELLGSEFSKICDFPCDYRYFYSQKNYIFYRTDSKSIKIVRVLNEKRDFNQILFTNKPQ